MSTQSTMLALLRPSVVVKPNKDDIKEVRLTPYPRGTLKELFDYVKQQSFMFAVSIESDRLSTANISTLHQEAYRQNYNLHVIKREGKRVLWVERKIRS